MTAPADECPECKGRVIDDGDELVCTSCGVTTTKVSVSDHHDTVGWWSPSVLYTSRRLGGFIGSSEVGEGSKKPKGLSSSPLSYVLIKRISDAADKGDEDLFNCGRVMERICEKLSLSRAVAAEGIVIARDIMPMRKGHGEITLASVSAFSLINACKRLHVTSVGLKDIMRAHKDLGYHVRPSVIIHLSMDGPVKTAPMRAEDYLVPTVSHLRALLDGSVPMGYFSLLLEAARHELAGIGNVRRGGHSPRILAATALYAGERVMAYAGGRDACLSQDDVSAAAGVKVYTIKEQYIQLFKTGIEERFNHSMPIAIERHMERLESTPW